jgi:hypothetical protein
MRQFENKNGRSSSRCSALYQSHNQYNHGDYKKEVDQGSSHMADEPEQPEHQQNNKYCPKHEIRQLTSELLYNGNEPKSVRI